MSNSIIGKLAEYLAVGDQQESNSDRKAWKLRVKTYLGQLFGSEVADEFSALGGDDPLSMEKYLGFLEALSAKLQGGLPVSNLASVSSVVPSAISEPSASGKKDKKVFVVHGHDVAAKETLARFLEKLGLDAIILHEQPNIGQTVIEKFELFSDVGFAVVLLTPDDVGYPTDTEDQKKSRARQNVILELGYFIAKLGRKKVCALYVDGVEMPSDYQGVVYIEFDPAGAWKTKLAQELVEAGMSINQSGLL